MKTKYSAIIADDHPIFRKGLVDILSGMQQIEIVAEVANGMDAYHHIISKRPDLAILDLEMPGLTGMDVCEKILNEKSETKFIILTMHREKAYFTAAMKLGVKGYILKDHAIDELITGVEKVIRGEIFVSPGIEALLIDSGGREVPGIEKLTATEKIILKLVADSKTSTEIAELLFVSPNTVDNHRANIVKKLGIEGKNSLLKFALQYKDLV